MIIDATVVVPTYQRTRRDRGQRQPEQVHRDRSLRIAPGPTARRTIGAARDVVRGR